MNQTMMVAAVFHNLAQKEGLYISDVSVQQFIGIYSH